MSQDLNPYLAPLGGDAPAGPDPGIGDLVFQTLVQAVKGETDYVFDGKEEVTVFRPPNWQEVRRQALDCLTRARDARIAIVLTRAMTALEGAAGLARGLDYLERLLETLWDDAHPAPDPDESDPAERYFRRINALRVLAENDGLPREIMGAPLIEARGIGRYSLRQIQLAEGKVVPAKGESRPEAGFVQAAMENDPGLPERRREVARATASLAALQALLQRRLGPAAPDLGRLEALLAELARTLGVDEAVEAAPEADTAGSGPSAAAGGRRIGSRAEVLAALDSILAHYRARDPASPIPLLLARIRRLVPLDFPSLLQELAPSSLQAFEKFADIPPAAGIAADVADAAPVSRDVSAPVIDSRADIIEILDAMIEFYHTYETSSPIPVLLQRVRRLVPLGFIALLKDIAPQGLAEFKQFADIDEPSGQ